MKLKLDGAIDRDDVRDGVGWMIAKNRNVSLNPTEDADKRVVEVMIRIKGPPDNPPDALEKVRSGDTSLEEVSRVVV